MSDDISKLTRRVAKLERMLDEMMKHTGTRDAVEAAEEAHQQETKSKGNDARARLSDASRAAHDVNQGRR